MLQVDVTRVQLVDGILNETTGVGLITKGTPSNRFIVIIEGEAVVEIKNVTNFLKFLNFLS